MDLPTGTVTFLFTDIEGSTRLWEEQPDAMRQALSRHDALLRKAIQEAHGVVFKTVGDAFCAAFATASGAVAAALHAQRSLLAEAHSPLLWVRMAIHTGAVEVRDQDYFGQPLNRVARLLSVAHGGQVLVSAACSELARDHLPDGCGFLDLGEHRLRDLERPERVYQLLHPHLPAGFPPLRTLENLPNNLPLQLTSFIGRGKEGAEIKRLLGAVRLVTLTGSGGCGKTRLAVQVGADMLTEYPDGVWLVELAPLSDGTLVPQVVAFILGIREEPGRPLIPTIADHLRARSLLLLLDNAEHLLAASAQLVDALLKTCPNLRILVTSRQALSIAGEATYRVPSLSLPDRQERYAPGALTQFDAVRLFIDRAVSVQPSFNVTDENAPAVAEVCHRLDGIPLAIELAAARVRAMPVEQVASRLDDRFRLLTGGSRTALPRQQTLRALIDWSYSLLTEEEQILLSRLHVFAGGWTLEAAEAVCCGGSIKAWEILDLLTGLVDKNLAIYDENVARYRLLETVRQYAGERLTERGAAAETGSQHLAWFLTLAEQAAAHLTGPEQVVWVERLEREHDNLREALRFSVERTSEAFSGAPGLKRGFPNAQNAPLTPPQAGLRLAGALCWFWDMHGHLTEGRAWMALALGQPGAKERTSTRAKALNAAGILAKEQGEYAAARAYHEESLSIRREIGDRHGIAASLSNLGNVASRKGEYAAAQAYYEESVAILRAIGDRREIATSLNNLGGMACDQGDYAAARAYLVESLSISREIGDRWGVAHSLCNLGMVAFQQDGRSAARAYYEESLSICRETGDKQGIADTLCNLGCLALKQGEYGAAWARQEEGLALRKEIGERRGIAESLESLAEFACAAGEAERAARLSAAAERLREEIGAPLPPKDTAGHERIIAGLRASMGEGRFAAAWSEGRAITMEQAIEYAMTGTDAPTAGHSDPSPAQRSR